MNTSQKKQLAIDMIAAFICAVMFFVMFAGLIAAKFDIDFTPLRISEFTDEQHIDVIASAFQYELADGETLRVAHFALGFMQGHTQLKVVIENVGSVESFFSRFHGECKEIAFTEPYNAMRMYSPDSFKVYQLEMFRSTHRDYYGLLSFFHDEDKVNAEFIINTTPPQLYEVYDILLGYFPSVYHHPFFIVPLIMLIISVLFLTVRVYLRVKRKK